MIMNLSAESQKERITQKNRQALGLPVIIPSYEPDEKLPSVRNLAVDLSINPNTIQRAYGELERQGYIYTVKGKGNFASDRENLLGRYKEEILKQLKEICRTALSVGMTETEIIDNIRGWGKL